MDTTDGGSFSKSFLLGGSLGKLAKAHGSFSRTFQDYGNSLIHTRVEIERFLSLNNSF